jgi:CRISPR-associated endonuclease/helicase Cas3
MYLAHVKKIESKWELHSLEDHLRAVAKFSEKFTNKFGFSDLGYIIGLWHDLGKYKPEFQERIGIKSGYDEEAHLEGKKAKSVKHAITGGLYAISYFEKSMGSQGKELGTLLAIPIVSHHSGLRDWVDFQASIDLRKSQNEAQSLESILKVIPDDILICSTPMLKPIKSEKALFLRMLFSCLIDADRLDTEKFMNPEKSNLRKIYSIDLFKELSSKLETFLNQKKESTKNIEINVLRNQILFEANEKAIQKPGFYSLTVPTGGGKTLTSLSFALKHLLYHKKDRIIYALPYTTIIEQNAQVFREILGVENVLEVHSSIDPILEEETPQNRLLSENWDHPLIVTTNVQLFESLFSSKTSRTRKLHNLINSVLILDEVQMLPSDYLLPIIKYLRELVEHYNVTVLFCTATQPAFKSKKGINYDFKGIDSITEIISDTNELFEKLKRVTIHKPKKSKTSWNELKNDIEEFNQTLTIVNRKKDALDLYTILEGNKFHLSTNMCADHRRCIIKKIKAALLSNEKIHVVSTQLIEAGVDIDFPVVFRAMTGLDSIAQSAGRCNREGRLKQSGNVFLFYPEKSSPSGHLLQADQAGRGCMEEFEDLLHPKAIEKYFESLFYMKGEKGLDSKDILRDLSALKFETVSNNFQIINELSYPVLVPYGEGKKYVTELMEMSEYETPDFKKIQRYLLNVRMDAYKKLLRSHNIINFRDYFGILQNENLYNSETGLSADNLYFHTPEELIL